MSSFPCSLWGDSKARYLCLLRVLQGVEPQQRLLRTTPFIGFPLSSVIFSFLTVLPGITSQMNYLKYHTLTQCLSVFLGGTQTKMSILDDLDNHYAVDKWTWRSFPVIN